MKVAIINFFVTAIAASTAFGAEKFICPQKVKLNSGTVAEKFIPSPFQASISDSPLWLTGASAYDGPPEEGAALKPASAKKAAKSETAKWIFVGQFERGKWVACDYGAGLVRLSVRINDSSSYCVASVLDKRGADAPEITITCN